MNFRQPVLIKGRYKNKFTLALADSVALVGGAGVCDKYNGSRWASVVKMKSWMLMVCSDSSEKRRYKYLKVSAKTNESILKKANNRYTIHNIVSISVISLFSYCTWMAKDVSDAFLSFRSKIQSLDHLKSGTKVAKCNYARKNTRVNTTSGTLFYPPPPPNINVFEQFGSCPTPNHNIDIGELCFGHYNFVPDCRWNKEVLKTFI